LPVAAVDAQPFPPLAFNDFSETEAVDPTSAPAKILAMSRNPWIVAGDPPFSPNSPNPPKIRHKRKQRQENGGKRSKNVGFRAGTAPLQSASSIAWLRSETSTFASCGFFPPACDSVRFRASSRARSAMWSLRLAILSSNEPWRWGESFWLPEGETGPPARGTSPERSLLDMGNTSVE